MSDVGHYGRFDKLEYFFITYGCVKDLLWCVLISTCVSFPVITSVHFFRHLGSAPSPCMTGSGISNIWIISGAEEDRQKTQTKGGPKFPPGWCNPLVSSFICLSYESIIGTCWVQGHWQLSEDRTESRAEPGDIRWTVFAAEAVRQKIIGMR